MDSNPIRTALNVCKFLIAKKVYAIIVSHPPTGELSPAAVSYTSGFYHIPVIGISSRDSAFSDKVCYLIFFIIICYNLNNIFHTYSIYKSIQSERLIDICLIRQGKCRMAQ